MLKTNKMDARRRRGATKGRLPTDRRRARAPPIRRPHMRHAPAERSSSLHAYLSIAGPSLVALTRQLEEGAEAYLWATAWKGRRRLFRSFAFSSSSPRVAQVVARGPDWAEVLGTSRGEARITAGVDGARASVDLVVVPTSHAERDGDGNRRRPESPSPLEHEDASEAFERRWPDWVAVGLILSVALHFGVFTLFPKFHSAALATGREEITAVQLPPEVHVPPPPELIARPATPKVGASEVSEEVTIAPTTFEANPVENLAPPPAPVAAPAHDEDARPRFIPYDTPPRLLNAADVRKLLQRNYPPALREARVEGRVILWIFIDRQGEVRRVQVQQSSGYAPMDEVAVDVGHEMEFSPAKNRDKATPVWVQQAIVFEVSG